jgi:spermidine/putrescine transport system ATP-binding protein
MSDRIAVMSEGRILQVGAPREIYDHPAERFVASFIGESNFLAAEVLVVEEDRARLRLAGGTEALADLPPGAAPRGTVTVAVRPEHVRLAGVGEAATIAATLEQAVYFGTDTHYHLRLDGGEAVVARLQNRRDGAPPPAPGDRVGVGLRPGSIQILKD